MAVQVWRQERCQRLSSWVDSDEVGAAAVESEHASLALRAAAMFQSRCYNLLFGTEWRPSIRTKPPPQSPTLCIKLEKNAPLGMK